MAITHILVQAQGTGAVSGLSTDPADWFNKAYTAGAQLTMLSSSGAYSSFYTLYNAMNDTGNTATGYGPQSWEHKYIHGDTVTMNYEEVLDAGAGNKIVVGDMLVTFLQGYENVIGTDTFDFYVSNDNANWTHIGGNTGEVVTGVTQVSLNGEGRYLKFVIQPVADPISNYARFKFPLQDNFWNIEVVPA